MNSALANRPEDRPVARAPDAALWVCFSGPEGGLRRDQQAPPGLLVGRDREGRATVEDRSGAETWLNGDRFTGERPLRCGDVLRVGDTLFVYATRHDDDQTPVTELVGRSAAMSSVRRSIEMVATRRHSVVITGETGTGKEVVARQIHRRSRRTGPFIAVNCSTFTDALLASELFGHARGAFTGAVGEHVGLFRAAHGGTLLLDEIADMPHSVQACLLRVLETRAVRPVGATRDIDIDVRVIATSNRELVELVRAGQFRADLYARLAQWTIRTPRLSERREDIPELVAGALPQVDGAGRVLTVDLCEALLLHEWPLNVRGLVNVLSIAVLSAGDDGAPLAATPEVRDALWHSRKMTAEIAGDQVPAPSAPVAPTWHSHRSLDKAELEGLMVRFEGQVAAAARHVGMTRPKLYRLLGAHGLEPRSFRWSNSGPNQAPS